VAFCYGVANQHPDHDTIATFRCRFLPQIDTLFVQVFGVARKTGVLKLDTVAPRSMPMPAATARYRTSTRVKSRRR
jgi:hypothetical protein